MIGITKRQKQYIQFINRQLMQTYIQLSVYVYKPDLNQQLDIYGQTQTPVIFKGPIQLPCIVRQPQDILGYQDDTNRNILNKQLQFFFLLSYLQKNNIKVQVGDILEFRYETSQLQCSRLYEVKHSAYYNKFFTDQIGWRCVGVLINSVLIYDEQQDGYYLQNYSSVIQSRQQLYLYCGVDMENNQPYTTTQQIKSLDMSYIYPKNNDKFIITIPQGAKMVVFAYPELLRQVSSVVLLQALNIEIKSIFVQTIVNVQTQQQGFFVPYRVYTFIPIQSYQQEVNYQVTV